MSTIKLLDNILINKIAAGEVVERPLSVVKELVENSIDAGSGEITVEVRDGGTTFIRITDNGRGIPREQVKTAFLRHATSKISNIDDLENVLSLGFRGEALSSISSVSQVEIVTKTINDITGTRLEINGGEVTTQSEIGCTEGTSITVKNLFYNVPARRKFLKKPATESGYISDMINKLAISNPDISFKYINNNSTMLQTKGNGDLKTILYQIYGKEVASNLIELDYQKSGIHISGLIGKPEISRSNRSYSLFFINGRYVKSEIVQSAVEEAFKTKLAIGKFPLFVVNMKISPNRIDVNVHPTKLEVRFSDEDLIYNIVFNGVNEALKSTVLIPETKFEKSQTPQPQHFNNTQDVIYEESTILKPKVFLSEAEPEMCQPKISDSIPNVAFKVPEKILSVKNILEAKPLSFFKDYKIIGQLFGTYWIIEQDNSMYLIDQHAAHERALYEDTLKTLKNEKILTQKLVQPIIIYVSLSEKQRLIENFELFLNFGFELEEFDDTSYAIYAVPHIFKAPVGGDFFLEILDSLEGINKKIENIYELKIETIATIACKAAVKANDRLSYLEARALLDKILMLENPFTCPHGRPTIIEISKYELEKKFKRIQ